MYSSVNGFVMFQRDISCLCLLFCICVTGCVCAVWLGVCVGVLVCVFVGSVC